MTSVASLFLLFLDLTREKGKGEKLSAEKRAGKRGGRKSENRRWRTNLMETYETKPVRTAQACVLLLQNKIKKEKNQLYA